MPTVAKYEEDVIAQARQLRRNGWSINEISIKTAIPKTTIQGWIKGIVLTECQKKRIKLKELTGFSLARKIAAESNKNKLQKRLSAIKSKASYYRDLPFKQGDIGKIVCSIMYLCEGGKYPATRCVMFGNSDPGIIKLFIRLLRDNFIINESKFRCRIMQRADQSSEQLLHFWSKVTGVHQESFYKNYIDKRTKDKKTRKEKYKGVCVVYYFDTAIQNELQFIAEEIIEVGGADGSRTRDLHTASVSCFQLHHSPM